MDKFDGTFFKVVNGSPYEYQRKAWEAFEKGKSIVVRAPTGSGKTEAVYLPFLFHANEKLPSRMIYALPLRALANQICQRLEKYAQKLGRSEWRVRLQHGIRPESVLLSSEVTIATIDQVITSYACTPLTLPVRHGNIPAGAVMSSFLVFDEVHLFDPNLALQAMRLVCERLHKLGLPFAVLSATLPDAVVEFWHERFDCEIAEAEKEPVERNLKVEWTGKQLNGRAVQEALREGYQRIIVVYNTVERAIRLFDEIRNDAQNNGYECQLLHSRFLPDDRARKEQWVVERFGKSLLQEKKSLLIATQVVEAGLDISCDCLLTELAPVDALIQRAGRCARWGGEGSVQVYDVESAAPYEKGLMDRTRQILAELSSAELTWEEAKQWVNRVLNDRYRSVLSEESVEYERVVAQLSLAGFTGNRTASEATIRDVNTVEVSIHSKPQALREEALRLPTISVHIGVVKNWLKSAKQPVWRVEIDRNPADARISVTFEKVSEKDLRIGDRLIFPPTTLQYDSDYGLREGHGSDLTLTSSRERSDLVKTLNRETWIEHSVKTAEFACRLLDRDKHAVEGLSRFLNLSPEKIREALALTAVLHDLGKLTVEWQGKAGIGKRASVSELLAHTDARDYNDFPSHATVSAYALWDALTDNEAIPRILGRSAVLAIAHHHSVRAQHVPKYELHPQWRDAVQQALSQIGVKNFPLDKVIQFQPSETALRNRFPPLEHGHLYTTYVLLARWLRLADRMATEGSEDAIFRYEDWFGGL